MKVGVCSYAMFWQAHAENPNRLSITEMVVKAANMGAEVFQICDDSRVENFSFSELASLRNLATENEIDLEVGTRGISRSSLDKYIDIAINLRSKVVRTLVLREEYIKGIQAIVESIRYVVPKLVENDIYLALETYEQIPTSDLVNIVQQIDNPHVGICLDPANTVSSLESPENVIEISAPYVVSLHVKDFGFSRLDGWVGFSLLGRELGNGLLNIDYELDQVYSKNAEVSALAEHWVPFTGDWGRTVDIEDCWTVSTLEKLINYRVNNSL